MEKLFHSNNYPIYVFHKCVKKFIDSKFPQRTNIYSHDEFDVKNVLIVTYFGRPSLLFKKKLTYLLKKELLLDLHCVFTSFKVGMYFSLKDVTPLSLSSNVVYKFTCLRDVNVSYIGKTKWHLVTRVREHGSRESAIFAHLENCNTCLQNYDLNCFKVIDQANCNFDCCIKEALLIKRLQPNLNSNMYSGNSFQLTVF